MVVGIALLVFPKLALGFRGSKPASPSCRRSRVMPADTEENPAGRIRGARRLLTTAALIMSSVPGHHSFTTVVLIPEQDFEPGGPANGRALAFLAHEYLGNGFGTVYDLSTIAILWFAGASAMAGLLNLVPRYLPRYGMAPEWARAVRPLVLVFTLVGFIITWLFDADVDAQGGAYATGVLVLMTSAAVAVTFSARSRRQRKRSIGVRRHRRGVHLHHRGQHLRTARRHPDRSALHHRDHRDLPALSHPALLRTPRHARPHGHTGAGIPGRQRNRPHRDHRPRAAAA